MHRPRETSDNRYLEIIDRILANTKSVFDLSDTRVSALHQDGLIGTEMPVYVELRLRESPPDDGRQCCLSFAYANIYCFRAGAGERKAELSVDSVNLDTIKGFSHSIKYIGLRNSTQIIMAWTEQTPTRTRTGICKYKFKEANYDGVESILDFAFLHQELLSLNQLNGECPGIALVGFRRNIALSFADNLVIGCGSSTVFLWDHRNGNLLLKSEIASPPLGRNIACHMLDRDVSPNDSLLEPLWMLIYKYL